MCNMFPNKVSKIINLEHRYEVEIQTEDSYAKDQLKIRAKDFQVIQKMININVQMEGVKGRNKTRKYIKTFSR